MYPGANFCLPELNAEFDCLCDVPGGTPYPRGCYNENEQKCEMFDCNCPDGEPVEGKKCYSVDEIKCKPKYPCLCEDGTPDDVCYLQNETKCKTFECICPSGTADTSLPCKFENEEKCLTFACNCPNGIAEEGEVCPFENSISCVSCEIGYELNEKNKNCEEITGYENPQFRIIKMPKYPQGQMELWHKDYPTGWCGGFSVPGDSKRDIKQASFLIPVPCDDPRALQNVWYHFKNKAINLNSKDGLKNHSCLVEKIDEETGKIIHGFQVCKDFKLNKADVPENGMFDVKKVNDMTFFFNRKVKQYHTIEYRADLL